MDVHPSNRHSEMPQTTAALLKTGWWPFSRCLTFPLTLLPSTSVEEKLFHKDFSLFFLSSLWNLLVDLTFFPLSSLNSIHIEFFFRFCRFSSCFWAFLCCYCRQPVADVLTFPLNDSIISSACVIGKPIASKHPIK